MAEYYLVSQLPSLDGLGKNTPLPIDEERFSELCSRHLGKKAQQEIDRLTVVPSITSEKTSSALLDAWYEGERNLRLALGKVRADKLNKSFDLQNKSLPVELIRTATEAANAENPLEAENLLLDYRLNFLESLRPLDTFCEDYVFYYGLKLKMIMRMQQFDKTLGETAYKDIYSSIINGDRTEATK